MRVAVILKPGAGASLVAEQNIPVEQFEALLFQRLSELGIDAEIHYTTPEDPGESIARQLATERTGVVIAVGGDGTIHSVARGLLGSQSVLGIIPAGTMNNLAYSLGIPADLKEACSILINGSVRTVDVGSINHHFFLEVAGIGLEAALYPAAEAVKGRGIFSTLKGVVSGLYTLILYRPPQMSVVFDHEKPRTYRAIQITVCNTPYYGVHLNIAPNISMDDGWLDAVLYTNFRKGEYLRHAISISQGRRPFTPKIIYRRMQSLRICTNKAIEFHADGVVLGNGSVEITILPAALRVQVPKKPVPGLLAGRKEQTHVSAQTST